MQQINLKQLIESKKVDFFTKKPKIVADFLLFVLNKAFYVKEINTFLAKYPDSKSFSFIDDLFEFLDFSYYVSAKDKAKIPAEGRLIIVSNHPLGALDGLSLLRAIGEVRQDVKIVANDMLSHLENAKDLFLPVDVFSLRAQKENLLKIEAHLQNDGALIMFPAAEVSRLYPKGIRDKRWQKGAIRLARKYNAPILPMHVKARNTMTFYLMSLLNKGFSTFLLAREIFKKSSENITLDVGFPIPSNTFSENLNDSVLIKLLRKHVYNLGKGKRPIFNTERTIIHPVSKQSLKLELGQSVALGNTRDGKKIFLSQSPVAETILTEISRLREITFRKVGEGTGNKADIDIFDKIYKHIVLWDDTALEIVGSYRLGVCDEIIKQHGLNYIYTKQLFNFSDRFVEILESALEVGRSFVQQKYWGSNALDYLWQGIGAFLSQFPKRYLYGAVSISDTYNEDAKALLVSYYRKWYGGDESLVSPNNPYIISQQLLENCEKVLVGSSPEEDMRNLKNALKNFGLAVPVLLRKYCDICEYGGVKYLGYGVDPGFGNSLDCFILVDLDQIKPEFKERYYTQKSFKEKVVV